MQINYENLKKREPILWFDEVIMYETELDDNGHGMLQAKIRVMPSCFFILQRYWLRLDQVVFRIVDTRIYHEFKSSNVIIETTTKQEKYDVVVKKIGLPASNPVYSDPNQFGQHMPTTKKKNFRIALA